MRLYYEFRRKDDMESLERISREAFCWRGGVRTQKMETPSLLKAVGGEDRNVIRVLNLGLPILVE